MFVQVTNELSFSHTWDCHRKQHCSFELQASYDLFILHQILPGYPLTSQLHSTGVSYLQHHPHSPCSDPHLLDQQNVLYFLKWSFQSFPMVISSRQLDIQVWSQRIEITGELGRHDGLASQLKPQKVILTVVGLKSHPWQCRGLLWSCSFLVHENIKHGEILLSLITETDPYFTSFSNCMLDGST